MRPREPIPHSLRSSPRATASTTSGGSGSGSPADGTHVGVGVVGDRERSGETPLWLVLHASTPGYAIGRDRLQRSKYAPFGEDEHGVWVPIEVDPGRQWSELRNQIYERVREIRDVLAGKE